MHSTGTGEGAGTACEAMERAAVSRVLVVEDDPAFAAAVAAALAEQPDFHCVSVESSAAGARAALSAQQPDLLLVDLGLDGDPMAGVALIAHARHVLPHCECLAVTVFDDGATVLAAIEAGASGYVLKGCTPQAICEHLREVRSGGSPLSPRAARWVLQRLGGSATAQAEPTHLASDSSSPPHAGPSLASALSSNEITMLQLAAKGCSHDEVARLMGVTRNTVLTYAKRCYRKLQVHSRSEAVYEARRMGLLRD